MKHETIEPSAYYPFKIFSFESKNPERLIATHWHESGELLFCMKGELKVTFPNNTYLLKAGDILFINSSVAHSSTSPTANKVFILQFSSTFLKEMTKDAYNQIFQFNITPKERQSIPNDYHQLQEILTTIYQKSDTHSLDCFLLIMAYTYQLFAILCQSFSIDYKASRAIKSVKYLETLQKVDYYVREHYQDELRLDTVAELFGYNTTYFSRFFKQHMGVTFSTHVNSIRLEKAYYLLRDTDRTILDISTNCGFYNVKSFYNVFKKNYHLSPQKYRQQYFS